ncbi:2-methylaconitate cis-trans isomerase PrpF family protein [Celeribacter sp.]|uniref:2-methylaconitate cis-trans isomerase PrpF family protein n=1 Tax=Celeribacter sp. TaxID=1890673 RepID=UPI003A8F65D1
MPLQSLRCAFMRGGTSKGLVFDERDLPDSREEWDVIFLAAMGSPDPNKRQLDGMGGGVSSLSKVCVVGPSSREDADVDYTFAQVSVTDDTVDYSGNCGNMSSAIGPFAVYRDMVQAPDTGGAMVRIYNTNTGKVIHSHFQVENGQPVSGGDFVLDGVAGAAAPIRLDFMNPAGAKTGKLLPSGFASDILTLPDGRRVKASLVDVANPFVFVDGRDLGMNGRELPSELEENSALKERLEQIRCAASVAMNMASDLQSASATIALPKITALFPMIDAPTISGETIRSGDADILSRTVSVGQFHNAIPLTGALCLASAMRIPGTVAANLMGGGTGATGLTIAHPSGCIVVDGEVYGSGEELSIPRVSAFRSARLLFDGAVYFE